MSLAKILLLGLAIATVLPAETGYAAWLRYSPISNRTLPATVVRLGNGPTIESAQGELIRGLRSNAR